MSYFCVIHKGIIYSAGICSEPICRQLSELEYNAILSAIHNKPVAKLGESTKLENTRAAVNTVIKMAQLTAQELQQTLVEDLKARAVDGKLSETNILVIRKKLQAQTREKLSDPVCNLITTAGIDLGALISGAAEAWIGKQKNYAWGENGGN